MDYTLLFQKSKTGSSVKDSLADFGMVCTDVPFMPCGETKELPKRDWIDEDGEDTYIPDSIPLSAFDWEIEMGFKDLMQGTIEENTNIVEALIASKLASSKREAREFIQGGAVTVNGDKITSLDKLLTKSDAIDGVYLVFRRGKKKYGLLKF